MVGVPLALSAPDPKQDHVPAVERFDASTMVSRGLAPS